jgi:hypothetical protein
LDCETIPMDSLAFANVDTSPSASFLAARQLLIAPPACSSMFKPL